MGALGFFTSNIQAVFSSCLEANFTVLLLKSPVWILATELNFEGFPNIKVRGQTGEGWNSSFSIGKAFYLRIRVDGILMVYLYGL